jgi:hypothetical protein
MTFGEMKDAVARKGFGTQFYDNVNGEAVYLSRGIRELYLGEYDGIQTVISAVARFQNKDYGDAADCGKVSSAGHEYGRYVTDLPAEEEEDTAIWIHRDAEALLVYFRFER